MHFYYLQLRYFHKEFSLFLEYFTMHYFYNLKRRELSMFFYILKIYTFKDYITIRLALCYPSISIIRHTIYS